MCPAGIGATRHRRHRLPLQQLRKPGVVASIRVTVPAGAKETFRPCVCRRHRAQNSVKKLSLCLGRSLFTQEKKKALPFVCRCVHVCVCHVEAQNVLQYICRNALTHRRSTKPSALRQRTAAPRTVSPGRAGNHAAARDAPRIASAPGPQPSQSPPTKSSGSEGTSQIQVITETKQRPENKSPDESSHCIC